MSKDVIKSIISEYNLLIIIKPIKKQFINFLTLIEIIINSPSSCYIKVIHEYVIEISIPAGLLKNVFLCQRH